MNLNWLLVFIGGGLGSLARLSISNLFLNYSKGFPTGTFLSNIIASFIAGFLIAWLSGKINSEQNRHLLLAGFCGGFSTFSTFSAENLNYLQEGKFLLASVYIILSIALCIVAAFGGYVLGMKFRGINEGR